MDVSLNRHLHTVPVFALPSHRQHGISRLQFGDKAQDLPIIHNVAPDLVRFFMSSLRTVPNHKVYGNFSDFGLMGSAQLNEQGMLEVTVLHSDRPDPPQPSQEEIHATLKTNGKPLAMEYARIEKGQREAIDLAPLQKFGWHRHQKATFQLSRMKNLLGDYRSAISNTLRLIEGMLRLLQSKIPSPDAGLRKAA